MTIRALVVTVALAGVALPAQADTDSRAAASVVAVRSVAAPFEDQLVLRGATEADRRVDVRAEISGLVASPPIRKGAVVETGDVLCELDPGERPANLKEAEADLRQAEVEYNAAQRLREKGFTAETEALTMGAALEAARARLLHAEIGMERLRMTAPFDGVLESDTAELGSLLQEGSLCATLLSLDPIKLVAFAPERDVGELKLGAPAVGRLVTGREVEGKISFVSRAADADTRTYRVEIAAPNPALDIRDGMTAEIVVPLASEPAHFAPQSALTLNDDGRLGVRLVEDGAAEFHSVELLRDEADGVWLGGLDREAEIIVVGQEFVGDGHPVEARYVAAESLR